MAALEAAGIPVVGGLGLWLQEADRSRVVCITGTKGKSTTTAITGHLLAGLGFRCLVAGNIGVPPFDPEAGADFDYWVVEVSSYQALDLAVAPAVVGVTSLHADHLPWHGGDVEQYYRDKLSLCALPGAELTVANGDSALLAERRSMLGPRVQWVRADDDAGAHLARAAAPARCPQPAQRTDRPGDAAGTGCPGSRTTRRGWPMPQRVSPVWTAGSRRSVRSTA